MSNGTKLLVPIRIDALVVGGELPSDELFQWTNLTPDFYLLQSPRRYLFGSDPRLYKLFEKADPAFMAPGIHLHFRLPRALTHGTQEGSGPIQFPRIPNRWLVQRTWRDPAKNLRHKAWLIKSDVEAKEPWSDENPGVTWPEFPAGRPAVFKSIGLCEELAGPVDESDEPATLKLTAIGPGDPTFSAYYPACRSVLGFHDTRDGLESGSTELSYLVTGWYSMAAEDELQVLVSELRKIPEYLNQDSEKLREALCSKLKEEWTWACPALAGQELPSRLVCHGLIRNVALGMDGKTGLDGNVFPRNLDVHKKNYEVAVGEAPGEALAALFKKEQEEVDQDLLTALQAGLLSQDTTISDLRYQLHALRFGGVRGGTVFHVKPESEKFPTADGEPPQRADTGVLPKPLRDQLRQLNDAQAAFDRQADRFKDCIWQSYSCWYLWMRQVIESGPDSPKAGERKTLLDSFANLVASEQALLTQVESDRNARKNTIENTLKHAEYQRMPTGGPLYGLTESSFRPFDEPNDPIVAMSGPAMQRLNTWQEIDALPCRLSNAVPNAPAWQTQFGGGATGPGGIHSDLLFESILQPPNDSDKTEAPPTIWGGNPWIPLFLVWRASWQSDYPWEGDIASNLVNSRWTLARHKNADSAPDLALINTAVRPAPADYVTYQGRAILTSSGAKSLRDALASVKRDHPLINTLNNRPVMSQALDGLHEAMTRRQVGTRLPALEHSSKKVPDNPVTFRTMPSDDPFFPIRAGRLRIRRLYVVDAFGQTVMLPVEPGLASEDAYVKVHRAHNTFIDGLKDGEIELRPRFATPMRLQFELESAGPVCGWVLPNHMEHSLGIYSATGQPLGAFQQRLKRVAGDKAFYWVPFPAEKRGKDGPPHDDALGAFCDWVGGLEAETGDTFSALLDKSIQATDQRVPEEDPGISVLVGRPLALVRASLRLESPGLPAHSPELTGPVQPNALEKAIVTRGFEKVKWPVRIGDHRARNDGVVGVFKCSSSGTPEGPFIRLGGKTKTNTGSSEPRIFR